MDILKLKGLQISYRVESKIVKREFRKFNFFAEEESILMKNENFFSLEPNEQYPIVIELIDEDRRGYNTKKYDKVIWEPISED